MQIKATPSFLRQANRLFRRNPSTKDHFKAAVDKLARDPFDPSLKTHKLKGDLKEFWSCSLTFELRLRFKLSDDAVELIDIGTHDEVY